jgi:ribosomal protein S18 acetylase RimI-like enzyme
MRTRNATSDDGEAIRDIAERSMEASYSLSPSAIAGAIENWYSEESFAEKLEADDVAFLVAETEEAGVVGFSESLVVNSNGDILWLHVDPMYRGEGIGDELYEVTRRELQERGVSHVRGRVLADNREGNDFYEQHGLSKVAEGRVDIDGTKYVENIYADTEPEELQTIAGPEKRTLYVDRLDSSRGSEGPFYVVYTDSDREERYAYYCGNCESLVTSMDSMGRMECTECGNQRKPTRWDAAYM